MNQEPTLHLWKRRQQVWLHVLLAFGSIVLNSSFLSCSPSLPSVISSSDVILDDGMFLVERYGTTKSAILPVLENEKVIAYNREFIDHTDQDKEYLVVNTQEFVPLELAESPETKDQDDNRKLLLLQLSDDAKKKLKSFTAKHLNALTAIVVNNEALTKHKIKSVIDGGLLQITRCTDNACEMLYNELQDNVVAKE